MLYVLRDVEGDDYREQTFGLWESESVRPRMQKKYGLEDDVAISILPLQLHLGGERRENNARCPGWEPIQQVQRTSAAAPETSLFQSFFSSDWSGYNIRYLFSVSVTIFSAFGDETPHCVVLFSEKGLRRHI
jgi:hypothetical protein